MNIHDSNCECAWCSKRNRCSSNCSCGCSPCCCPPVPPVPPVPPFPPCPECLYSVIYLPNNGTGGWVDGGLEEGIHYTVKGDAATGTSRPGYTFSGWNTQPDGSGITYHAGNVLVINGDVVLYAQWAQNRTYSVTYDANDGTGAYSDAGLYAGDSYTVKAPGSVGIERPGYIFLSWTTRPDGSGATYYPGDVITVQRNVTLYAQWKEEPPDTYTVTYHNNATPEEVYESPPDDVGTAHNVLAYEDTGMPVPPSFSFNNWNTQSDGSGATYLQGSVFAFDADTSLYAQWVLPT